MLPYPPTDWIGEILGNVSFRELACDLDMADRDYHYTIRSPFSRLLLGLRGQWMIHLPGGPAMLRPEQMLLVPTDVEATYQQRKGVRFYWLYFRADYAGAVDLFRLAPPRRLLRSGGKRAASQFRQLIRGFRRQDLSSRLSSTAILVEFLVPFLKGAAPVRTGVVAIQRLLPVLRYIDEHLREEITNDDLARLLYLSPKYFCNLFSAATGVPPVAYIHQRRVLRAKERLLLSSETIKSIAVKVGFRDPLYFARVFRRLEGVSPREYRARYLRPQ